MGVRRLKYNLGVMYHNGRGVPQDYAKGGEVAKESGGEWLAREWKPKKER
jgi:TPR repeat protein